MNVVILGGGIAGLLAATALIERGIKPTIIERGALGGQWGKLQALKYLRHTPSLEQLVINLGVPYTTEAVNGGMLLMVRGRPDPLILKHPDCMFGSLGEELLRAHWYKTRRSGVPDARAMNKGSGMKDGAIKIITEGQSFLEALIGLVEREATIIRGTVTEVVPGAVNLETQVTFTVFAVCEYDRLISTLPLPLFQRLCPGASLPEARYKQLIVQCYRAALFAKKHRGWDYLYTPWTPEGAIHRLAPGEGDLWYAEANLLPRHSEREMEQLMTADAVEIFGRVLEHIDTQTTNGHLLPLDASLEYPYNILPLGRFAEWESRGTADYVWHRARRLAEQIDA